MSASDIDAIRDGLGASSDLLDVGDQFGVGLADDSPYYDPDLNASSEPYHVDGYWPPSADDDGP